MVMAMVRREVNCIWPNDPGTRGLCLVVVVECDEILPWATWHCWAPGQDGQPLVSLWCSALSYAVIVLLICTSGRLALGFTPSLFLVSA